jgi:hypothetical protein
LKLALLGGDLGLQARHLLGEELPRLGRGGEPGVRVELLVRRGDRVRRVRAQVLVAIDEAQLHELAVADGLDGEPGRHEVHGPAPRVLGRLRVGLREQAHPPRVEPREGASLTRREIRTVQKVEPLGRQPQHRPALQDLVLRLVEILVVVESLLIPSPKVSASGALRSI